MGRHTMKQLKYVLAGAGLIGIIAAFLPYISIEGHSMTFWDFHKFPSSEMAGLLKGPKQVYVAFACFAVPLALGCWAMAGRLARWMGGVSSVFFLAAFGPEGVRKGLMGGDGVSTAIGGKLLFLAALVGLVASIATLAKPETK
jgi:hypothetical protein